MKNMEAVKVTNPVWLGNIAPQIEKLCRRIKISTITYESLYTYFAQTVQFGGENAELWVVFDDQKPIAFAHWLVRGLPHVGTVYMDFLYNASKKREPVSILIKEYSKFGKKHHAPFYEGDAINKAAMLLFNKYIEEIGYVATETGVVNFLAWRKPRDENNKQDSN